MKLDVKLKTKYSADGSYTLRAPGCILATLFWAEEGGALEDYTPFGVLPLVASNHTGSFFFTGGREIPPRATHILVRAVGDDLMGWEEELFPLPEGREPLPAEEPLFQAAVLSDIHLSTKTGALYRALEGIQGADCLLLTGDMTNDGREDQFQRLKACLEEKVTVPIFCVSGNHDLFSGGENFSAFREYLRERAGERGIRWETFCEGGFLAHMGQVQIIGLDPIKPWKELSPINKAQITALDQSLSRGEGIRRILLCHTPLSRELPIRNSRGSTYLSRDAHFQETVDAHRDLLILSGHTHLSPNLCSGTVRWDEVRNNIYINCGSVRPTELGEEGLLAPKSWAEGVMTRITLTENQTHVQSLSMHSRKWISRGCYRFG